MLSIITMNLEEDQHYLQVIHRNPKVLLQIQVVFPPPSLSSYSISFNLCTKACCHDNQFQLSYTYASPIATESRWVKHIQNNSFPNSSHRFDFTENVIFFLLNFIRVLRIIVCVRNCTLRHCVGFGVPR